MARHGQYRQRAAYWRSPPSRRSRPSGFRHSQLRTPLPRSGGRRTRTIGARLIALKVAWVEADRVMCAADDRIRRVVVVATRSGEGPFTHRLQTSIQARRPRASWMEARITKLAEVLRRTYFKSRSRSPAAPTRTLAVSSLQLCAYRQ